MKLKIKITKEEFIEQHESNIINLVHLLKQKLISDFPDVNIISVECGEFFDGVDFVIYSIDVQTDLTDLELAIKNVIDYSKN